jgi:hypothetical protein
METHHLLRRKLPCHWLQGKGRPECDCCGDAFDEPGDWMILSSCGHLLCTATCSQVQEGHCPVNGCSSHYQSHQMIPGYRLAGASLEMRDSSKGGKPNAIAHLIKDEISEDDQVLVIVQSAKLRHKAVDILKEHKISHTDLKSTGNLATQLTKFQHSKGRRDKVLINNTGCPVFLPLSICITTTAAFAFFRGLVASLPPSYP